MSWWVVTIIIQVTNISAQNGLCHLVAVEIAQAGSLVSMDGVVSYKMVPRVGRDTAFGKITPRICFRKIFT